MVAGTGKAGQTEVLIDNLPGMPDGVDAAADGGFWVSLVAPAPPFNSLLLTKMLSNPLVRALYARLKPGLKAWGAVVKVDGADGRVLDFLTDPTGRHVSAVSAVTEHVTEDVDGGSRRRLYLGNLVGDYVSYVDLGPSDAAAAAADESPRAASDGEGQGQQEL
ncbi:hypothetical protein COO60DRAFT_1638069 [Scenedesmus sp. NREL 46B-D3]|nr:hypothetical protein COO60DRAFT_1638069 [Scenedesmus sp. NREL 46B-D3]